MMISNKAYDILKWVAPIALVSVEREDGVDVPYLYEATYYSIAGNVIQKIKMADKVPQPTYFARPDYLGERT